MGAVSPFIISSGNRFDHSTLSCASIPVYLGNLCQTDTEKIEGGNRAVNLHNFNHMSEAV